MLAYIDGGTGGIMLQVLLGGLVGAFVILKATLSGFFGRFRRNTEPPPEPTEGEDASL